MALYHRILSILILFLYHPSISVVTALWRRAWVGSLSGEPFWEEGDALPTSSLEVNRFLTYTEATYNVVLNTVGRVPAWNVNNNEIMFGVVESQYADLRGVKRECTYGDAYFTIDTYGNYGTVFCDGMATAFWVGHEWGHGYSLMAGLTNEDVQASTISEFISDVLGYTVQTLASPQYPDSPRVECSQYGVNPGFAYIEGKGGNDPSKRWIAGVNCTSEICPTRDMWDPTCFSAADRMTSELFLCGNGNEEPNGWAKRTHMNNGVLNKFFSLLVDGGSFNGQHVVPLGLGKSVRIVLEAILPSNGSSRVPNMSFRQLAKYLENACVDAIATVLKDLQTGELLNDTISNEDCNQVSSAIAAVEMTQDPSCSGGLLPTSRAIVVAEESFTIVLAILFLGAFL